MVGFGCVPNTEAEVEHDRICNGIERLVGSPLAADMWIDYSRFVDRVCDQGPTQSCVANWFSTACYLAGQAQGKLVPRPSRRWAYAVARYTRTPGVLIDTGSSARMMCVGSSRHGIVSEERLPFEPAKIDEPPPFDADIAGADALFTGYYRAESALDIRRALSLGHFPGTAIRVYEDFERIGGDGAIYDVPSGAFRGQHMITAVGCKPGAILYINSWGTGWGMGGYAWLSDRFVDSHDAFDKYVVTSAPVSR